MSPVGRVRIPHHVQQKKDRNKTELNFRYKQLPDGIEKQKMELQQMELMRKPKTDNGYAYRLLQTHLFCK